MAQGFKDYLKKNVQGYGEPFLALDAASIVASDNKLKSIAKTIRDIWNRKTWTFATRHLWVHEEIALIESGQGDYAEHQVCINEKDSSILS